MKHRHLRTRLTVVVAACILAGTSVLAEDPERMVLFHSGKEGYPRYLEWAADNLRPGGVVLLDNAFLFGHLPDEATGERAVSIQAMQAVHHALARGGRFRATVLPTGEGLAMGVRV